MSDEAWYTGTEMPEGYEPSEKMAEFGGVGDVMKAYDALRTDNSTKIRIPGEDASDDDRTAFQSTLKEHLGLTPPESPDEYSWKPPEGMEAMFTDMGDDLKKFHEAGYDDKTVSFFMNETAGAINGAMSAMQTNQAEIAQQSEAALKEKWGDSYTENIQAVQKVQERFPEMVEALKSAGLANHQAVIEGMYDVAMSVREDKPPREGGGDSKTLESRKAELKAHDGYMKKSHPKHNEILTEIREINKAIIKLEG